MFKRIIMLVIAMVMMSFLTVIMCFADTKIVETNVGVPPKILFIGDSIPAGYGLDGYSDDDLYSCQSYPVMLGDMYKEELDGVCSAKMVNRAVSGDTSLQLLAHIKNGEFDEDLKNCDAVVISIGGNDILEIFFDFLQNDLGLTNGMTYDDIMSKFTDFMSVAKALSQMTEDMDSAIEQFGQNIDEIISSIESKTDAKIIYQTQYDPLDCFDEIALLKELSADKIGKINDEIISHSTNEDETQRYILADVYTEFSGKSKTLTNISDFDIHPNAEGHKIISETVDKAVRTQHYTFKQEVEVPALNTVSQRTVYVVLALFGLGIILLIVMLILRKKGLHKHERT